MYLNLASQAQDNSADLNQLIDGFNEQQMRK